MTEHASRGPQDSRARAHARPPVWQPWQLHRLGTELAAWNAGVRRAIEAYDADRRREAELDALRLATLARNRRARDARLRRANQRAVAYRNERLGERR